MLTKARRSYYAAKPLQMLVKTSLLDAHKRSWGSLRAPGGVPGDQKPFGQPLPSRRYGATTLSAYSLAHTESTTDTIIIASTSKQGRDLLRRCLGPAQSKLQHPLNRWLQLGVEQLLLDCLAAQRLHDAVVLLQPCLQLGNPVDGGDFAGGDFSDFRVNFLCRSLGNLACSFSKGAIDVEAALIDPCAQLPQRLLRCG